MKRGYKTIIIILVVVFLLLMGVLLALVKSGGNLSSPETLEQQNIGGPNADDPKAGDFLNGRAPSDFTWEEYQNLTPDQQAAFPDYFESLDAYKSWFEAASDSMEIIPLEDDYLNGRDPASFTWKEFTRLTPDQQAEFPDCFESLDAYQAWYQSVCENAAENEEEIHLDNDFLDGKKPTDFTWEEYQNLTTEQQAVFPDYFESLDAYQSWCESVHPIEAADTDESILEDDYLNGKDPANFTWEEYQNLTPDQQAMLPDYFESYDAFLEWKDKTEP